MLKLKVNDIDVEVEEGLTVLQACEKAGVEIPRFCYHEKLSIAGNCRMCLVEMEKSPKPIASCAMPAAEGMNIKTNTSFVEKARKGVMEFLLANHPLDCPVCDQGGECDLQDQSMFYGVDKSRFKENKRFVPEKNMGPLIKTQMTRCIHCTRCVRFATEVAGVPELGAIGRGEDMQITTYLEQSVQSELSGNVIDLCPVGALTSKPYVFEARPWELKKTESIDVMDAIGSNIRVDTYGWEVKRVLPLINEDINEEWISDKTRYACDGLLNNRIDTPYIKVNGEFKEATWKDVLSYIDKNLENKKTFGGVIGQLVDLETSYAFKKLFKNVFNSQLVDFRQKDILFDTSNEINYLFNTKINQIDECDFILLIGTNPRLEATIVNYRIRKAIKSGCKVYSIGNPGELNYKYKIIGDNLSIIDDLINDKITESKIFKDSKNPAVIIGESVLNSQISKKLINSIKNLLKSKDKLNGLNILHQSASSVGSLFLGLQCENLNDLYNSDVLYLLNADEIAFKKNKNQFVIYQGTHGGENSTLADVILPGAAYSEKDGSFANLEGRVQKSFKASYPPGLAKEDWSIFLEIAKKRNISIGYNSFEDLKKNMISEHNMLGSFDRIPEIDYSKVNLETYEKIDFKVKINEIDYYQTNIIARSSKTMMECKLSKLNDKKNGTEN